jgi:hypothetical protein
MTVLIIAKNKFSQNLSDQIKSGKNLMEYAVNTLEDLEFLKRNSKIWSEYNDELLKQSFSVQKNEYKDEYNKCVLVIGSLGNKSLDEKAKEHKTIIQKRVNCLESILNRLDLIPEK